MNADIWRPPRKKGALRHAPNEKLTSRPYHRQDTVQVRLWWIEAERLGQEYRRTRQERHLRALARHMDGIFEVLSTGGPR